MSKYFNGVSNQSELRTKFKELCKQLHPDCGGSQTSFVEMMEEYKQLLVKLANCDSKSQWAAKEEAKKASEYADLIVQLQKLSGVVIEQCGSWLYLHGNTMLHKEIIKQFGFRWSKNKNSWYWAPYLSDKFTRGRYSMNTIRTMYGSRTYNSEYAPELTAND
ncbi:MAG: hypothetical protein J6S67_15850 [Methanobrevibacter sp.]|nr:hypothetical protein [Methanobrevibacter sp.]